MPEVLLRKVKAEQLVDIAKGLIGVAGNQGFIVNIHTVYDYEAQVYKSTIDVMPKAQPIPREDNNV